MLDTAHIRIYTLNWKTLGLEDRENTARCSLAKKSDHTCQRHHQIFTISLHFDMRLKTWPDRVSVRCKQKGMLLL